MSFSFPPRKYGLIKITTLPLSLAVSGVTLHGGVSLALPPLRAWAEEEKAPFPTGAHPEEVFQVPPAATATLQPGSPGPPAPESSPLQRRSACSLQEPRSAAGAHIRAPNRGGVGSGEHQGLQVFWKTRYGENISLGVSRKLPLTLCFKHVRLQRTKCPTACRG